VKSMQISDPTEVGRCLVQTSRVGLPSWELHPLRRVREPSVPGCCRSESVCGRWNGGSLAPVQHLRAVQGLEFLDRRSTHRVGLPLHDESRLTPVADQRSRPMLAQVPRYEFRGREEEDLGTVWYSSLTQPNDKVQQRLVRRSASYCGLQRQSWETRLGRLSRHRSTCPVGVGLARR
jgi:hypothetical protein